MTEAIENVSLASSEPMTGSEEATGEYAKCFYCNATGCDSVIEGGWFHRDCVLDDGGVVEITKADAFDILGGNRCCSCMRKLTNGTRIRLTSADWCMDYEIMPCRYCWEEMEEWSDDEEEAPVMRRMEEHIRMAMRWEKEYRMEMEEEDDE